MSNITEYNYQHEFHVSFQTFLCLNIPYKYWPTISNSYYLYKRFTAKTRLISIESNPKKVVVVFGVACAVYFVIVVVFAVIVVVSFVGVVIISSLVKIG